uniref:DUF4283 domain-containing protein n=1 Tax=Salix viminalis TaxID=40686 RepID=A0A6N2ME21_SALVM
MAIPKETKKQQPPPKHSENTTSSSWADRVKVTDSSTCYTLDSIPQQTVGNKIEITEDMFADHAEQWSRSMVGFFPGFRMNFHLVNKIASRVWKSNGLESVTTTTSGFMIFRFKKKDQMLDILERGPWLFGGKAIILQAWHPHFVFDKNKISKLSVWIRLHGLPFPFLMASMVGRPLSCDESTFSCSRLDFARVCVEIDASIPLVHKFEIVTPLSPEPLQIEVEYEWAPTRCSKCNLFRHSCRQEGRPQSSGGHNEGEKKMATPSETRAGEGIQPTSTTHAVSKDAPAQGQNPSKQKGKAVVTTATMETSRDRQPHSQEGNGGEGHKEKHQVIEGDGGNFIPDGVHTKGRGLERCSMASLQNQSCSEEGTSSVCGIKETDAGDTSSLAYTKVKKKKGGKQKGKETRCL